MKVGVLLITHEKIGSALIESLQKMLPKCALPIKNLSIYRDQPTKDYLPLGQQLIDQLDSGSGVLILTDIYGSTPANLAEQLTKNNQARAVAGVNLPMLVKLHNYPNSTLEELVTKATTGGKTGILCCKSVQLDNDSND